MRWVGGVVMRFATANAYMGDGCGKILLPKFGMLRTSDQQKNNPKTDSRDGVSIEGLNPPALPTPLGFEARIERGCHPQVAELVTAWLDNQALALATFT